jgi:ubiquinone/menaquinone biosynthesis C-methylase UbiE
MKQTPPNLIVNNEVLQLLPANAKNIVEIGSGYGAMASSYKKINPTCNYVCIDIDPEYADAARSRCDKSLAANIEQMSPNEFDQLFPSDCWIFADSLEHLYDPWKLLTMIRERISPDGCIVCCIPNAQHWSVQYKLMSGSFNYEQSGLMDKTHIRWFTRTTMISMFASSGWRIVNGVSRKIPSEHEDKFLSLIGEHAKGLGLDHISVVNDSSVFQYVFKLVPI